MLQVVEKTHNTFVTGAQVGLLRVAQPGAHLDQTATAIGGTHLHDEIVVEAEDFGGRDTLKGMGRGIVIGDLPARNFTGDDLNAFEGLIGRIRQLERCEAGVEGNRFLFLGTGGFVAHIATLIDWQLGGVDKLRRVTVSVVISLIGGYFRRGTTIAKVVAINTREMPPPRKAGTRAGWRAGEKRAIGTAIRPSRSPNPALSSR